MRQFNVYVKDRPGVLASLVGLLANQGIQITAVMQERHSSDAVIKFVTNDENTTRGALERNRYYYSESEVLGVEIANKTGELAKVTQRLADAHVNVSSIYLMAEPSQKKESLAFVFEVSDNEAAKRVLDNLLLS